MSISRACYATREAVKAGLDVAETARTNDRVDRALETASHTIDGVLRRTFTPWTGTKYFPWPDAAYRTPWRLWLDAQEVVSVTSVVAGGVTIPSSGYYLEPVNTGPPFNRIEINLSTTSAFTAGPSRQRAVAITGVFGFDDNDESVGTLSAPLGATASAAANATWSTSRIGVGDLLHIDNERAIVIDRTLVDSGQASPSLTAMLSNVTVPVADGSAFAAEETILIDSERMRVIDVAGNTLTVKRAWDGSTLATHNGASIWTLTGVVLARAAAGSTIAAHLTNAPIGRHVVPGPVRDLAVALCINQLTQESSGYARVMGTKDHGQSRVNVDRQTDAFGRGLSDLWGDVIDTHARQLLVRAV